MNIYRVVILKYPSKDNLYYSVYLDKIDGKYYWVQYAGCFAIKGYVSLRRKKCAAKTVGEKIIFVDKKRGKFISNNLRKFLPFRIKDI